MKFNLRHLPIVGWLGALTMSACQTTPQPPPGTSGNAQRGFALAESGCTSCHAFQGPTSAPVAPNWAVIAKAYERDEAALMRFLRAPGKVGARVDGALEQFGPMPDMGLTAQQARDLAAFIAEATFDPVTGTLGDAKRWRAEPTDAPPLEQALNMARATKSALGKQLMAALASGGPVHAVPFCNERAIPLTDSVSRALNARIRRVSDRPRNPENRAHGAEWDYLKTGHAALASGQSVEPAISHSDNAYIAYVPILTNAMCLQCHGTLDSEVQSETQARIAAAYPSDEATGYGANELRGMWVVEFARN